MALAVLLIVSLLNAGVMAQEEEEEVITGTMPPVETAEVVRGDMVPMTSEAPATVEPQGQVWDFPSLEFLGTPGSPTEEAAEAEEGGPAGPEEAADEAGDEAVTNSPIVIELESQAPPQPARGDGPANVVPTTKYVPLSDVMCVTKEAVEDKDAVSLTLTASSNCEETRVKIASVLQDLCGEDCKLDIYQKDNTNEILVSGQYVEDDAARMADMFNNDNIKDKIDVEEAVPRWGKNSKLVLVSLLLTGLILAALLVAGYYLKTHRKTAKGVRLAESFQVDEENQANTLVSVAPLPQEPLDKPTVNGESPPENGNNPAPATNGHSAAQAPVADTEM